MSRFRPFMSKLLFTSLLEAGGGLPAPVFESIGAPNAAGSCGSTRAFEANSAFAQR